MALLFDLFGFLSVVLRVVSVTGQAFTLGGIAFLMLLALRIPDHIAAARETILHRSAIILRCAATALATAEILNVAMQTAILTATTTLDTVDALQATYLIAVMVKIVAAVVIVAIANPNTFASRLVPLAGAALVILLAAGATSHAAARIDGRVPLIAIGIIHQVAAAVWIGGLPYFIVGLLGTRDGIAWRWVGKRFSVMSMASVAALLLGGIALSVAFIGSIPAAYGTAYGAMVGGKAVFLGVLLVLGFMNFRTVERLRADPTTPILRLRRFAEVEIGIGITVFCIAASLSSVPPAIDLPHDRATLKEIYERLEPRWPSLKTPDHADLAIPALQAKLDAEAAARDATRPRAFIPGSGDVTPSNAFDIAWSEYNHHWAGLIVLAIGLLALGEKTGYMPWGRHWPLLFLALAVFLFFRSDPEAWPLGDIGFWESMQDAGVVQHRIFVPLVVAFGIFEWGVRNGRITNPKAALVFPLLTAIGGALLLMHSHPLVNLKDSFLIEITHLPLAIFGVLGGWARWLELRLPPPGNRVLGWIWPLCFIMVAIILIDYRES